MTRDYIVNFKLPSDSHLFIRHATNTRAKNPREAIAQVRPYFPDAFNFKAELGVVLLYGESFSTYDSTLGCECAPLR